MRTMKNISVMSYRLWVVGVFLLLMSTIQAVAVDYTPFKGTMYDVHRDHVQRAEYNLQTTVPTVGFQSTSAYSDQWNQDAQQSMLNADGSIANEPIASAPGVRRAPGTPGGQLDPTTQQPLGDGLWIMTLCALAYLIVRASRKRVC